MSKAVTVGNAVVAANGLPVYEMGLAKIIKGIEGDAELAVVKDGHIGFLYGNDLISIWILGQIAIHMHKRRLLVASIHKGQIATNKPFMLNEFLHKGSFFCSYQSHDEHTLLHLRALMDARRSPPSWRSPAAPPPPPPASERATPPREQILRRFSSHEHAAARASAETDKLQQQQRRSISYRARDGERDEASRTIRESFHNAVTATSDSADLTAYYAFSRRRASSVSVICDEGGRSSLSKL